MMGPNHIRKYHVATSLLAWYAAAMATPTHAMDMPLNPSGTVAITDAGEADHHGDSASDHGKVPAGVMGATMVGAGKFMLGYTPTFMHMSDNYIGSSTVSPQTIVTTIPSGMKMGMMPVDYRVVPTSMDSQMHMFHAMAGITDWLNVMVMADYQKKTMQMTTFAGMSGTRVLGSGGATTSGFGDTAVVSLWRLYDDGMQHVHLNLGLSLPSGSTTQTMTMLSPMNMMMTMRASYGMQLGTGTVDLLPGLTYTGHMRQWSWGSAWRGRFALDNNDEGYHYGGKQELTGWGGYTWVPGVTTTVRAAGSIEDRIHGADPLISGLMPGTNPAFYGGKRIDLLGGFEIAGAPFGLGNTHLSVEGGGPVYQDLNGPQLGHAWQLTAAIGVRF